MWYLNYTILGYVKLKSVVVLYYMLFCYILQSYIEIHYNIVTYFVILCFIYITNLYMILPSKRGIRPFQHFASTTSGFRDSTAPLLTFWSAEPPALPVYWTPQVLIDKSIYDLTIFHCYVESTFQV